jgi:protein ImuB
MAKRFVSIWFPHLATDWFELRKPQLKSIPFVLSAPSHGKMIITAANPLAQKKGIHEAMVLADARALFPDLVKFDDRPNLVNQLLQRLAEWCIRFTPSTAVDPSGGIILDASGCAHLWGSEEAYVTDIINRLSARGYYAKAAMADTIGTAWAVTRFGKHLVIEKGKQIEALLDLPPEAIRIDADTIERLHKLGLHKVRDFISIPHNALRRRFGPLLIQRLNQALGIAEEFIQPVYPVEPYQERLPCPEPIVRIEGIEIALQTLLEQLCKRLQKEGKGLRVAYFRGYRVDSKTVGIQISTNSPSCNVKHLFHLFQMKLSTIEPDLGIELFLLEATRVEDYSPRQEEFWKETGGLNDNCLSELIDRLSGKIGGDVIHRYLPNEHYWPERSFKKASSLDEQTTTEWKLDRPRPLLLLSPPERIEVTAPIPDYPPMLFRYKGKLHKISKADGPERIEQEWWIEEGEHRDYYAVEDEEGCRYWLFRSGHYDEEKKPQWFIHGFFA